MTCLQCLDKTSIFFRIHGGWLILRESSLTHWSLSPVRCPPWPRSQPCRCSPPVFSESVRPPLGSPPDGPCSRSYHLQTHTVQHTSAHTHLNMDAKQTTVRVCVCVYLWTWHRSKGYRTPGPPCEPAPPRCLPPAGRHTASFYWGTTESERKVITLLLFI